MKITIKSDGWRSILIKLYILANVIDAGGGLGLKYISAIFVLILLLGKRKIKINYMECFLFLICPIILFGYAVAFCGVSMGAAISSVTFCLAILFSIVLVNEKIERDDIFQFFLKVMYILAMLTITIFVSAYMLKMTGYGSIYSEFAFKMRNLSMGFFGYSYVSGFTMPIVYFRSSMFMIFGLALACYYKEKKSIIVIFMANMLASTTANIIFSLFILIYYIFGATFSKSFKIIAGSLGGGVLLIILVLKFNEIYEKFYEYFDDLTMKSASSQIKIGHIVSIIENMFSSIRYFLFGMGGGSSFYSIGREAELVSCEVSQMECWRRFGTIYTVCFFLYILYVIVKAYKVSRRAKIISFGILMMFIATASNPQLMSPLFLIMLFICNSWCNEKRRDCFCGEQMEKEQRIYVK